MYYFYIIENNELIKVELTNVENDMEALEKVFNLLCDDIEKNTSITIGTRGEIHRNVYKDNEFVGKSSFIWSSPEETIFTRLTKNLDTKTIPDIPNECKNCSCECDFDKDNNSDNDNNNNLN